MEVLLPEMIKFLTETNQGYAVRVFCRFAGHFKLRQSSEQFQTIYYLWALTIAIFIIGIFSA